MRYYLCRDESTICVYIPNRKEISMCSIEKQLKICSKHHLNLTDTIKLMGTSYQRFKPVWDEMVENYELETGKKLLSSWGLPTTYVLKYLEIDYEKLVQALENEKRLV